MKALFATLAATVLLLLGAVAQPASATANTEAVTMVSAEVLGATGVGADEASDGGINLTGDEIIPGDPYAGQEDARATLAECKFWFIHNKPLYRKYCL
ncbi:hypothetical protein [Leucobacter chromiireducens]|uniref:hypothetical protein n=1 Tax=Leucobacter chromiireducens TaxID=283877 RepID=UPI003F80DEAF